MFHVNSFLEALSLSDSFAFIPVKISWEKCLYFWVALQKKVFHPTFLHEISMFYGLYCLFRDLFFMSFSRYIPFEGCGGPERTESLWGQLVYCLLLPAVVRSVADGGATRVVTTLRADLAMVFCLSFLHFWGSCRLFRLDLSLHLCVLLTP